MAGPISLFFSRGLILHVFHSGSVGALSMNPFLTAAVAIRSSSHLIAPKFILGGPTTSAILTYNATQWLVYDVTRMQKVYLVVLSGEAVPEV